MKLSELANQLLRHMAKSYADTHKRSFFLSDFQELYPDLEKEFISDALRLLKGDGFVDTFGADGTVYCCWLTDAAIAKMENQNKEHLLSVLDFISKFIP